MAGMDQRDHIVRQMMRLRVAGHRPSVLRTNKRDHDLLFDWLEAEYGQVLEVHPDASGRGLLTSVFGLKVIFKDDGPPTVYCDCP